MSRKIKIALLIGLGILASGFGLRCNNEVRQYPQTTLEYWGVFESPADIGILTKAYTYNHPKIKINYRTFREEEYKQKLLESWALGQGPDMFMIPVTRIREFLPYIMPMPASMEVPRQIETGTIKKEITEEIQTYSGLTPKAVRDSFIDTVASDVVIDNKIYGLPFSIDTLSVYYNRDILKNNNIALPAKDWNQLIDQAAKISKVDEEGNFVQSAIAMGGIDNISNVVDIVSTLMMQTGVTVGTSAGPQFQVDEESLNAIRFYLSFATEGLQTYSWTEDQPQAIDAFTAGKLAYFIGYPYHAQQIRQVNPKLNWDVIPMFQPENTERVPTYANYWVTVVTNPPQNSAADEFRKASVAWQFVLESTGARTIRPFLNNPDNPRTTALKEIVPEQQVDLILAPYAKNLLNAENWYRGKNYPLAETYFLEMLRNIRDAASEGLEPAQFVSAGASRISQTY